MVYCICYIVSFFFNEINKNKDQLKKELFTAFFSRFNGLWNLWCFSIYSRINNNYGKHGYHLYFISCFYNFISILFFKEKISFSRILGLLLCLIGVFIVISKGNFNFFINFKFTSGDLWMTGAALGWALYSIYLINWKSTFSLMARFTLIAMFGCLSLFPFFLLEGLFFAKTNLNLSFLLWVLFAAISPSIIAFSLYSKLQKYLGASLTGFTLYFFAIYGSIFGIIIFEESLMPFHYLGATFVFTGVYLAKKN